MAGLRALTGAESAFAPHVFDALADTRSSRCSARAGRARRRERAETTSPEAKVPNFVPTKPL